MKKLLNVMMLSSAMLVGGVSLAGSREEVVRAASHLTDSALGLSELAHKKGYHNTERTLEEIAELSGDVGISARFDSRDQTKMKLKAVVMKLQTLKMFLKRAPSVRFRIAVKSQIFGDINVLGSTLMADQWIAFEPSRANNENEEEQGIDSMIDALEELLN